MRKLHTENLHILHLVLLWEVNQGIWTGKACRERRDVHKLVIGKPQGQRPIWRNRRKWEDNSKMNVKSSSSFN